MKNKENLINAGCEYLDKDMSVMPVVWKKPCIDWKEYQKRIMDKEVLIDLIDQCKATGIAIITGSISNLTVVDVDSIEIAKTLNFPKTPCVETSRGFQYFFRYHPEAKTCAGILNKVDIRSEGGYVVAPPSVHPSGKIYKWIVSLDETELAEFPMHMFQGSKVSPEIENLNTNTYWTGVKEGIRNVTAARNIGKLLKRFPDHEWESFVWPMIKMWNKDNNPPLDLKELKSVFNSICNKERRTRVVDTSYTILSIKVLCENTQPESDFLIDKLLPKGINVMSGQPGTGKSWIMLEIARSVASGKKFLETYETKKGAVLIIDSESGPNEIVRRSTMMQIENELPIYILSEQNLKVDEEKSLLFLIQEIERLDIKLLIIDPFSAVHNKTENNAEEIQKVMESLQKLKTKGVTILFIHHHRKEYGNFGNTSDSLRGSSVILSRVDAHIIIKKSESYNEDSISTKFILSKLRNGKKEKPFEIKIEEFNNLVSLSYSGNIEVQKSKSAKAAELIAMIINDEGKSRREILEHLHEENIGERTASEVLRNLEKIGQIKKGKTGQKNVYFLEDKNIDE
jgi:hypothetical protein